MRLAGEPSVDEILDSIKKVIARDDRAGSAARQQISRDGAATDPGPDDEDVLDLADLAPESEADQSDATPLITAESRSAMRESLASLALMAEPPASPRIVRSGETSLEALTRELLRPALAEWLDQHLPAMVEKLVAREIARIVGKTS